MNISIRTERNREPRLTALVLAAVTFGTWSPLTPAQSVCPRETRLGNARAFVFDDGSVAMRTELNVNPDGTKASYMAGDHGFTYIANGVDLWRNGRRVDCRDPANECRRKFLRAETESFGAGTDEFCAFALEVEPPPRGQKTPCTNGIVIGNGKGKPRVGGTLETVAEEHLPYYASTTSLMHTIGGRREYIDSAAVPSVVVPRSREDDLGRVVWVRAQSSSLGTFAIVADIGPAYGEGSIALHQLLRRGQIAAQRPGPIPREQRCEGAERSLQAPYGSRPDVGGDRCGSGGAPQGGADIRAYDGMKNVDFVYLGGARLEPRDNVIAEEVNVAALEMRAASAGYTVERIREMLTCLDP